VTNQKIDFRVNLPIRHSRQAEIANSCAKRKVVNAGRRGGKTTLAADISVSDYFLDGRTVMYAAPVGKQTDAYWNKCKHYLADGIRRDFIHKDETRRILKLGSAEISCQTAHNADTLRSGNADLLIFDEWAYMDYDAWDKVGSPMLLDNNGDAIFISTPNRRNHHFTMFQRGLSGEGWESFLFPSTENPYLSKEAFGLLISDMTEDSYRQEILAEFLEGTGVVFRNLLACLHAPLDTTPKQHHGHMIVAGVDWAKQQDYTCISIGCVDCKQEVARDRMNQIDYHLQWKFIDNMIREWQVNIALVELNSIGDPGLEALTRAGLPVIGFETTASSKPPLVENMALCFERTEWQFQQDPVWTGELEAYERKVSPITGRSSYSAPEGMHDDTVVARALMLWAVHDAYEDAGAMATDGYQLGGRH